MAKNRTIQIYRGTAAQNNAYTGAVGELTMDTTTNEVRIHDGSTAGGHKVGHVDIDNSTITKNGSDQIQAVATANANVASGATNPIYDWVGTLAEYTTQNIATAHPDWICLITDDFADVTYDAYSKTQSDNLFVTKGHQVIEFQEPEASNNYTWFRKYADGWVEQGGQITNADSQTVTLPVVMPDANYQVLVTMGETEKNANYTIIYGDRTTTGFNVYMSYNHTTSPSMWQVSGMMVA